MTKRTGRFLGWVTLAWAAMLFMGAGFRVLADCSSFGLPFVDLGSNTAFCAAIGEAYYAGLTAGTTATTFSPTANVTRTQAVAFATRTLDASLVRGSRRAALDQWWTQTDASLVRTNTGNTPALLKSDGADIWVANYGDGTVSRVRASDGKKLEDWTSASGAEGVLIALSRVFVTGNTNPGHLYMLDPSAAAGPVTTVASTLGNNSVGIAFDGNNIWTANTGGSVSIITPGTFSVSTVTTGFSQPLGIVFDGSNIWVTDSSAGTLLKLDSSGAVIKTVTVGTNPDQPAFDGHNIWVPNFGSASLTVVRATDGTVLKTFSAGNGDQNGLNQPTQAAFDGQRILVTNFAGGLSLFKATDLSIIGNPSTPDVIHPFGVCSDSINFWVSFSGSVSIGRF